MSLYINYLLLVFVFLFSFILLTTIYHTSFRYRIVNFYLFLLFCSIWGFYYSFEGFIFLLLLSELLIVLIFTLIYLTLQFKIVRTLNLSWLVWVCLLFFSILCLVTSLGKQFNFTYENLFFLQGLMVSDDFFIFFYFFFIKFPAITTITAFLLTIFSIFFILFYFSFKLITSAKVLLIKSLYLLRRQSLVHQACYRAGYQTFQR